jgi:hypothetical protein
LQGPEGPLSLFSQRKEKGGKGKKKGKKGKKKERDVAFSATFVGV